MNAMIDPTLLKKYLAGDASDAEAQQCEAYLGDPANHGEMANEADLALPGDSLVETLRNLGQTPTVGLEKSRSESLIEQIQSLVPSQDIDQDVLDRILDPPEAEDELGRIGRYRVIEFVAGGGMGLVFKASDAELQRLVCIKVLHPILAVNSDAKVRFAREAKAAARLRNARIVTVLEVGEHRDLPFLVMELLDGQSLRDKLAAEGKLNPAAAIKLTRQIAEGLRYAHGLGYLHRDIKPENIWVTTEGDIKLLDFGLARAVDETTNLTNTGTILGTPSYMSPEQVQGKELDARSDLFSAGSVLFEMLTGESPFGKSNLFSTMMSVANDSIEFPNHTAPNAIPVQLMPIVQTLLKKSPLDRTPSAEALIAELEFDDQSFRPGKTKSGGSGMGRGWIGLLGGLAGAACVALAFLLYQINDKGTLIIEADPSVSVTIANEQVSIHDPETGKKFKVAIGDHPLPSGVYQLELTDESGQYTLSSEVIAIRRGEQQIVRVELKPKSPAPANGNTTAKTSMTPESKPAMTLAKIATLSATDLRRKLNIQQDQPLLRNSLVTNPIRRKDTTSWSIELPSFARRNCQINADGSLIASPMSRNEGFVEIWDRTGKPVHMIPAQDVVKQVSWSPDPNVIAVVENGERRKQVTIWKLFGNHLEAIDVIAADTAKVSWSWDGLLLALQGEKEIWFVDLSKGSVFAHPNFGINGEISEQPWSLDGRYFAATVDKSVKIWDLEERKIFHIFASAEEARFLPVANQIAVNEAGKWEIWDLDSFERRRVIEPDSQWLAYWPDQAFKKVAAVSGDRKLIIKDIHSGSQVESKIELDENLILDDKQAQSWLRSAKLRWSHESNHFVLVIANQTFVSPPARSQDTDLKQLVKHELFNPTPTGAYVPLGSGHQGRILDYSDNRIVYHNDPYDQTPGNIFGFDLSTFENFPPTEFAFSDTSAVYRISPDGKSVAIVGSEVSLRNHAELPRAEQLALWEQFGLGLSKVRICSVETGKITKIIEIGEQIIDVLWSPDSKSLVVSWIESVEEKRTPKAEREKYRSIAVATVELNDTDGDGELNLSELDRMRNPPKGDADQNKDGQIGIEELIDFLNSRAAAVQAKKPPSMNSFRQLAVKVIEVSNGHEKRLEPGKQLSETSQFQYCFQQDSAKSRRDWDFAKPILYEDKIALPLFDPISFRSGRRPLTRRGQASGYKDSIGLFDIKSGQLVETIELNQQFRGNRLAMTDDMIMIGRPSREGSSLADSCFIIDRKNGNKSYVPSRSNDPNNDATKGLPYLSSGHPFIAIATKDIGMQIWKLDSKAESLTLVKVLSDNKGNVYSKGKTVWHPTEPTVAWINEQVVNWYNVEKDQLTTNDSVSILRDVIAIPDGWLVSGSQRMIEFDLNLDVVKTYLPTQRINEDIPVGVFDQCVTADGKILRPSTKASLRAVVLRDNRIETLTIEEFEQQSR